ncbi:uncharacterized protein [Pempheris klunzingeri]|uniref:uncharacterized protein n=1 Tax=Pempheris klunzingeri TaxID=3127111 RepID=UPI00397F9DF8
MMDNLTANKSHIPCQSWGGQNGWSTASAQGLPINPLPSSQHLSLGSSSDQRPSCGHLRASNQSCMSDLSTISSSHHSSLYKASHISGNPSSAMLFSDSGTQNASNIISFAQQNPHILSVPLTANQGKNMPPTPLPQTNQAPQTCRPQHLLLLPPHDPYKASFQPLLTSQSLLNGLQGLPSCRQRASTSQATSEGEDLEFSGIAGYTQSLAASTSQEQCQWIPSSHCRGAVNESVPDAAAHPNKETLQNENASPLASNDRQRTVLLHQRAQLLKQLSELDKCLESIPPDNSNDGQSSHTAVQCEQTETSDAQQVQPLAAKSESQWHLSADSSPSAYDDHREVSDAQEDPMSAAESEKQGNASAKSDEESDPDYVPKGDGDLSDFLSDPDEDSADEPSHSSPASPTDEGSSLPGRKRTKSKSSLSKDKSVSPPKKTCAKKKPAETVVLPCSSSKVQRVYDRRNYCLFCSKPMSKMARHYETVHSEKPEVAAAFQYPKNSRERQKIWNRLINQGNFVHNKNVLKTGKGQLAVRQRPKQTGKATDFLHCLYCQGLYRRKTLHRHMRQCPEKVNDKESQIGRKRVALRCLLQTSDDLDVTDGFKNILLQMTYDDVTQAVMEDKVILQFGELMFNQHGSDVKRHDYIRQNLRQVARLLLEAQKITPLKTLEDFFLPSSFPHVVTAVNVLAGYNPDNKTYSSPSLAVKLGYHLQKTCSIVEANAMKAGDESLAKSARKFLSVYEKNWNKLISSDALTTLREIKFKTAKKVPYAQDVKRLYFHIENEHVLAEKKIEDSPSPEDYAGLAKAILARTIIFNRRSAREVSTVPLAGFMSRKKSNLHAGMDVSVTDLERTMCGFFFRIDIRGKCGRMVPILLKPAFVSAMELLVSIREKCGVPSNNPFLFGRPYALSAYNGSGCLQKYVKTCGAKNPEALSSAKIRKHYATMLQLMNLDENEADQILGPNNQVRALRQDSSVHLDDVEMASRERSRDAGGQQAASWQHNQHSSAHYGPTESYHERATEHGATRSGNRTAHPKSSKPGKKGSQNNGKQKWEEAEVRAVERHLMHLIQEHKVPQKNDCIQCLDAEPEALSTRSWKGVKDYVRNRITALKRQSGTSQAKFKNE